MIKIVCKGYKYILKQYEKVFERPPREKNKSDQNPHSIYFSDKAKEL